MKSDALNVSKEVYNKKNLIVLPGEKALTFTLPQVKDSKEKQLRENLKMFTLVSPAGSRITGTDLNQRLLKRACLILIMVLANYCYGQGAEHYSKLIGSYSFYNDDSLIQYLLSLHTDHTFKINEMMDLTRKYSSGKWYVHGDTLVLTSNFSSNHLEIAVHEETVNEPYLDFGYLRNLRGEIVQTALLFINDDTLKPIDLLGGGYQFKTSEVKSFRVYAYNMYSKSYNVRDRRSNKFVISLKSSDNLNDYLFLDKKKLLISKGIFYMLTNNKIDSILTGKDIMVPIALKKLRRSR